MFVAAGKKFDQTLSAAQLFRHIGNNAPYDAFAHRCRGTLRIETHRRYQTKAGQVNRLLHTDSNLRLKGSERCMIFTPGFVTNTCFRRLSHLDLSKARKLALQGYTGSPQQNQAFLFGLQDQGIGFQVQAVGAVFKQEADPGIDWR